MGRLFVAQVVGALGLVATGAQAGELASAAVTLEIGSLPGATFEASSATTGSATSDVVAGLDAGTGFNGQFTTPVTDPEAVPITQIQVILTKNGLGDFAGATPDLVAGEAVFEGVSNVKGIGGLTLLGVPLAFGVPGTVTKSAGGIDITVINAAWTAGTGSVDLGGGNIVTRKGSNELTPDGGGTLTLVSPGKVISNLLDDPLTAWGTLELTFVPEPALPLMLLAGAGTLAAVGARRRR